MTALRSAPLLLLAALTAQSPPPGLAELPAPRPTRALQFSSFDRSGGNEDSGNFLRLEPGGTRVLAEVDGPGRITRLWSANPEGDIAIELDGEVVFAGPFARLFDQSLPPFGRPLAGRWGGGFLCHVPMPFLRRLRITSPPGPRFYYHVGVELGAERERFALPPGPHVQRQIATLLAGARTRDEGQVESVRDVPIVGSQSLVQRAGAGELLELRLLVRPGASPDAELWLEVRYDGEAEPAVAVPLPLLFAALPEQLGDERTLRLPMPFRTAFDLRVVDRAPRRGFATTPRLDVDAVFRALPADHGRRWLHARHRRQPTAWGEPFAVLDAAGAGHFVGLVMQMQGGSGQGFAFLEGDETIAVDGEVVCRGTGTEDLFSGAWYFRTGTCRAPFHAVTELDAAAQRTTVARFFVADPIPFQRSLRFLLEHGGANDTPGADYRALAFWYADSPRGHAVDPGQGPAEPPLLLRTLPAAELWPALTRPDSDQAQPFLTRLPAGPLALARDSVVTLFERGSIVHGPCWLFGDAVLTLPTPLVVDTVRLEPILPAIRAWRVAGPFPGGNRQGIAAVYGPERNADPGQRYDDILGGGERGWREPPARPWPSGYVDLNPLFAPNDEVVAYAATEVHSPGEQDGVLLLGSDDAVQVFWNGAMVHEHRGLRGAARDQDRVPLRLRAGSNRLLIKVEDYLGGFGLFARIEGAAGLTFAAR